MTDDSPAGRLESAAAATLAADGTDAPAVTLRWLVRLRWAAIAAQALIAAIAAAAGWLTDTRVIVALVLVAAASNVALAFAGRRRSRPAAVVLERITLFSDVVLLTAVLAVSGGPANPFSVVYLVYVTLAAVTLGPAWTWAVVAAATGGYASLFLRHLPLSPHALHGGGLSSHLAGMWLAFAATAALIAVFVTGVTRTLAEREHELARLRERAARNERLAALTMLAAGVAHELATPLGSIAIAARELQRSAERQGTPDVLEDASLIRAQVERCRRTLDRMSGRASQDWVEQPGRVSVAEVAAAVRAGLAADRAARLRVDADVDAHLVVPAAGLTQVLLTLVGNAFDASSAESLVTLSVMDGAGDDVVFTVRDDGGGMPADVLSRAGEPFFTTKGVGRGFGLGLFLVRTFAERQGGRLDLVSEPGRGTTAALALPREQTT